MLALFDSSNVQNVENIAVVAVAVVVTTYFRWRLHGSEPPNAAKAANSAISE